MSEKCKACMCPTCYSFKDYCSCDRCKDNQVINDCFSYDIKPLYAVAPEMYEALKYAAAWMEKRPTLNTKLDSEVKREVYKKIRDAITKVRKEEQPCNAKSATTLQSPPSANSVRKS